MCLLMMNRGMHRKAVAPEGGALCDRCQKPLRPFAFAPCRARTALASCLLVCNIQRFRDSAAVGQAQRLLHAHPQHKGACPLTPRSVQGPHAGLTARAAAGDDVVSAPRPARQARCREGALALSRLRSAPAARLADGRSPCHRFSHHLR